MTKLSTAALLVFVLACNTPSNEVIPVAEKPADVKKHDYGVKFSYSSDFSLGDPALADKVISMWKHYDANTIDSTRSSFADSVFSDMPGYAAKLQADTMIKEIKVSRAEYSACTTSFDAILTTKAEGKDETVVLIWGVETATKAGKTSKRDLHEVWGFNKDGKVTWIKQFELKR
jgi:hypothetical protein